MVAGLNQGKAAIGSFATVASSLKGVLAGLGIGAGIGAAIGGFKAMITQASDLSENVNKVKAIFGEGAASVIKDSDRMAEAFGTSKNEYLEAAGKFGGLFKGAGFTGKATADLSQQFTRLAGDAASFFNTDFDAAFNKLRSGLAGESEPLRDFGVFLDEATVKSYAYSHGLAAAGSELTNQQKIQARSALIAEGLADANGDLARTAGGVANLARNAWGQLQNLGATLGEAFLPLVQQGLSAASSFLGAISGWVRASGIIETLGSVIDAAIIMPLKVVWGLAVGVYKAFKMFGVDFVAIFNGALKVIKALADGVRWLIETLSFGTIKMASLKAEAAGAGATTFKQVKQTATATAAVAKGLADAAKHAGALTRGTRDAYHAILESRAAFERPARAAAAPAAPASGTAGAHSAILASRAAFGAPAAPAAGAPAGAAIGAPELGSAGAFATRARAVQPGKGADVQDKIAASAAATAKNTAVMATALAVLATGMSPLLGGGAMVATLNAALGHERPGSF